MIILEDEKKILEKNNINVEKYIQSNDLNGLLSEIDDLITYAGFDEDYLLNEFGEKIQKIYDDIFIRNGKYQW